ncbi:MAG: class I SAM-dependent methyltransferase [Luteimonas sp.]
MSLFQRIADLQGDRPWGAMLDAGTGRHSMQWLLGLGTTRWTAVTGADSMARKTSDAIGDRMRPQDRLVVGNWIDPDLLAGERYDTVLADYLLGAIEGFAPYWQDRLFERLHAHVAPGGRLYVVGLAPYVPQTPDVLDEAGRTINRIGRLRDACLLLSGGRPYREYPVEWTLRQLERAGFRVLQAETVPIRFGARFVDGQLDMCVRALDRLDDRALADAMRTHVDVVRTQAHAQVAAQGGLRHGHDYVIAAERVD